MATDIIVTIVAGILLAVAVFGTVYPVLPSSPVALVTLIALGHAVGLRFGHEGEGGGDAPVPDLLEEVIGQVLAAVVQTEGKTPSHIGPHGAMDLGERHGHRLQGSEAGASLGHVVAHALGVPVLHAEEAPDPPVVGREDAGAVGAPDDPGRLGGDHALVEFGLTRGPAPRREKVRFAHEPEKTLAGDADFLEHPQAGPHLAVALAAEGRGGQILAD